MQNRDQGIAFGVMGYGPLTSFFSIVIDNDKRIYHQVKTKDR